MEIKPITRDVAGLIQGVDYVLSERGLIDWRKMIRPEFLVVNSQKFEKAGKPVPDTIEGLSDKDLFILLAGIKDLAKLRGYSSVTFKPVSPSPDYVVVTCEITWVPNFETEGRAITFSAIGDAGLVNTNDFARLYLGAIAENRAFVRCVRNFLGISIVGEDEVAPKDPSAETEEASAKVNSPHALLEKLMEDKKVTFADLKAKLVAEQFENADSLNAVKDIPKVKVFELIERLKKKRA